MSLSLQSESPSYPPSPISSVYYKFPVMKLGQNNFCANLLRKCSFMQRCVRFAFSWFGPYFCLKSSCKSLMLHKNIVATHLSQIKLKTALLVFSGGGASTSWHNRVFSPEFCFSTHMQLWLIWREGVFKDKPLDWPCSVCSPVHTCVDFSRSEKFKTSWNSSFSAVR